jgi:histidinol-phosphate phosphatase family protein
MTFDLVVPTVGRDSLSRLLDALGAGAGPLPGRVLVVDDRRDRDRPLLVGGAPGWLAGRVEVVQGRAAGPAAARNAGWRRATAEWVAFLDDDVVPSATWLADLAADLERLGADVAASQGRIVVPMPGGRRPTDWERNVRWLETARWATADMAYRRGVLVEVGGFDERFPRAYREDADLGLRVVAAGYRIVVGRRVVTHPVRPAGRFVSVRLQAGNADDVLTLALHGRAWRERAGVTGGRRPRHLVVTALGVVAIAGGVVARRGGPTSRGAGRRARWARRGRRAGWARWVAGLAGLGWLAGTGELALARIMPGPRTADEVATMAVTSVLLPPAATWHWLSGWARLPRLLADDNRAPQPVPRPARSATLGASATSAASAVTAPSAPSAASGLSAASAPSPDSIVARGSSASSPWVPKAVLFDRDGTLVADVPYNGDPERVVVMPGAGEAVGRLRAAGVATAVVSNQSGVARGLIRVEQVEAVNRRVEELLGPLGPWFWCVHGPWEGCGCRKPAPGLIKAAAGALGVEPADCVVIGDVGSDVEAARAAGARAVLVPTAVTRAEEVAAAPVVAADLVAAVELVLGPSGGGGPR